jgi:hypothetical protein
MLCGHDVLPHNRPRINEVKAGGLKPSARPNSSLCVYVSYCGYSDGYSDSSNTPGNVHKTQEDYEQSCI